VIAITTTVNGRVHRIRVEPGLTLLELLRERLFLTGAKEGCGVGECGSCLVLVDDAAVNACLVLAADVDGRRVETIEGLAGDELDVVQEAFVAAGALQCGFCTPAMVLAVVALRRAHAGPSPAGVAAALSGVLCRCGTYPRVLRAVAALDEEVAP
jgi:aerobic-type carbon monoxide dehydrogenase small subunit (CoxS/CutS family)